MKRLPLTLVTREHWTDFAIGHLRGWAYYQEARTKLDGVHVPEHIRVIFTNSDAWRQVSVFGTVSLRVAIRAAVPAAEASPIVVTHNEFGRCFGTFADVDLTAIRKTRLFAEELEAVAAEGGAV